jgi:hypothetical protein
VEEDLTAPKTGAAAAAAAAAKEKERELSLADYPFVKVACLV